MSKGYFTNKNCKPTVKEIIVVIDKVKDKWDFLFQFLSDDLRLKGELKFYGINYGWAFRFIKSGKSVIALYPNKDCFTAQIILNKTQTEIALNSGLDLKTVQTIKDTEAIHEGKWVYLNIDEKFDIKNIIKLIDIRIGTR